MSQVFLVSLVCSVTSNPIHANAQLNKHSHMELPSPDYDDSPLLLSKQPLDKSNVFERGDCPLHAGHRLSFSGAMHRTPGHPTQA